MAFRYIEKDKYIIGFCEDILEEVFEELEETKSMNHHDGGDGDELDYYYDD